MDLNRRPALLALGLAALVLAPAGCSRSKHTGHGRAAATPAPAATAEGGQAQTAAGDSAERAGVPATAAAKGPALSMGSLRNAEYALSRLGDRFRLQAGTLRRTPPDVQRETFIRLLEPAFFGDLNGDGLKDAVVLLGVSEAGKNQVRYLVAVLNNGGRPEFAAVQPLGEHFQLRSISIQAGEITLQQASPIPNVPMRPRRYRLDGDSLSEVN
jgi:hypothetical protein